MNIAEVMWDRSQTRNISAESRKFGEGVNHKLANKMGEEFHYLELLWLKNRATALSTFDRRRISFLNSGSDQFANSIFTALPNEKLKLDSVEFQEAACCHMGRSSPLMSSLLGKRIRATGQMAFVDDAGYVIKAISGVDGGHRSIFHNDIHYTLANSLLLAEVDIKGKGPRDTCKNLFNDILNIPHEEESQEGDRISQGIIPDIVILDNKGRPRLCPLVPTDLEGLDTLADVKTLGPGKCYETPNKHPVTSRQEEVSRDYYAVANKLDVKYNGSSMGDFGPLSNRLNTYGKNGIVMGLVFGAFGEASSNVHMLAEFISRRQADIESRMVHGDYLTWRELKARSKRLLYIGWGLTVHRGWARMMRERSALLVTRNEKRIPLTQVDILGEELGMDTQHEELMRDN